MTIRKVAPQSATNHRLIWIATSWLALIFAAVLSFSLVFFYHQPLFMSPSGRVILEHISTDLCPQADPISPTFHFEILQNLDEYLSANAGKQWAVDSLSGAVQVPTQTFENINDPGNDTRWDVFHEMYGYLERRFPRIHSGLEITQINRYARIFQWEGSDSSLKPLVLTGHVDVIPVNPETEDEWTHPPFSGFFDGTWIWGRGSADDKSMVIATLSAVEALLEQGFRPMRTVVLAYGFDEERGGRYGARQISLHLQEVYGRGGAAMLVDEGGQYRLHDGVVIAAPNIAEKGSLNVKIEVTTPGGHSSMPPARTGIGFLSSLITTLEMNPFPAKLWRNSTFYHMLQCSSAHDTSLPAARRALIALSSTDDGALRQLEADLIAEDEPYFRAFSGTTQAIDIVAGGLKVNALPENAYAVANHRIAEHSSTDDVRTRYIDLLAPAAKALNLTFDGFGKAAFEEGQPSKGHVTLSTTSRGLRPAPVTPTEGSGAWDLLSGTILSSLQTTTRTDIDVKSVVVTPGIMIANSDTKWYWNLTSNIFRYSHFGTTDRQGMHTTDEAAKAEAYVESIRFWVRLILNADESRSLDS